VVLAASQVAPELNSHPSVSWVHIPVAWWPTDLLRSQIFAWRSFRWLGKHSHQLDVVHANGFITWAASDVNTAHFVHSAWLRSPVHTARLRRDLYGVYQRLYTVLNAYLEKRAYRQAGIIVSHSEKVRNELLDIGVPANKIHYIPVGVDLHEFYPAPADRRELGLPEGVPLALFVGGIRTPLKNLDTILYALVEVPGLHLAVVGATANSPYLKLAGRLGLLSRVHFLGYRRDVPQLMRAAELFVFPSRYESFSLVLLEAMASGLPVVTAATVGAAALVSDECGVVIQDPNDARSLAVALKRLVQSPESRKRMGRAARVVAEQHSWQRMSEQYLQVYEKIVETRNLKGEGVLWLGGAEY